jgi:hypothetical protein
MPEIETATMASIVPPIASSCSVATGQSQRPWLRLHRGVDWLLAGPQPDDIHNELLHQRTNKTRTLLVAIFASLLIASIAAGLTGAKWAYAWVLAELVLGSTRIYLMASAIAKAKKARRTVTNISPIWAGLT